MKKRKKSLVGYTRDDWIFYFGHPGDGTMLLSISHSEIYKKPRHFDNTKVRITIEEL